MIFRKKIFAALIISPIFICSLAQPFRHVDKAHLRMYDGQGRILTERQDTSENKVFYYTLDGDTLDVELGYFVEFTGGRDSLQSYLDAYYCRFVAPDDEEFNQIAWFLVLFDHNLKVVETRIMNRPNYAITPPLDSLFVKALNSSSGHWQRVGQQDSSQLYHITPVTYRIH